MTLVKTWVNPDMSGKAEVLSLTLFPFGFSTLKLTFSEVATDIVSVALAPFGMVNVDEQSEAG